ncbi:phage terminase small subunit-related protein [Aneurinibacillus sp. UBA3580]|uniref:phage terminase small subunit-related protein n=1 Tax=Aneurinibacillus sp. UBA3580 TaxID=1946041 RepID=UPI00257E38E0|nr:phage terminase small subunit-related protein [Aneurinibacillus sp. UBA3580]
MQDKLNHLRKKRDQAFEIWKASDGQKDLIEIAAELGVPDGMVRGWKNKDKWEQKLNGTFQTKEGATATSGH